MSQNKKTTLFDEMEKHYIDKDGKTIREAVDLGLSILRFFGGIHKAKEIMAKSDPYKGGYIDDFVLSIVAENFDINTFNANRHVINAQLAVLEGYDKDTASALREWVYSDVLDILNNPIFQHPVCKLPFHLFVTEGIMRLINAYVFSGIEGEEHYIDISYANLQCSAHVLAFLAFACNEDVQNYFSMNLSIEKYMYEHSKKVLNK